MAVEIYGTRLKCGSAGDACTEFESQDVQFGPYDSVSICNYGFVWVSNLWGRGSSLV